MTKAIKVIGGGEHDGATCWIECSSCHGAVDAKDTYCKHCGAKFLLLFTEEDATTDVRENVRGEWQKVDEQPYFRKHFHKVCCSVCRKQGYDYWNFCPNCGAQMEK